MTYRWQEAAAPEVLRAGPPPRPLPPVSELVDEVLAELAYTARGHPHPLEHLEETRRVLTTALRAFLDRVEHGPTSENRDALVRVFRAFGADEAGRGRTLECLHHGMRVAAAVTWRRVAGSGAVSPDRMAALGDEVFAFQEEVSAAASEGYARVREAGVEELRRRRSRLLEVLLGESGTAPTPGALATLARSARWRVPERVAVALLYREDVEGPSAPASPSDVLVDLERAEPCALIPDPEGPGRLRSLERSLRGFGAVMGPTVPIIEASLSLSRARELAELVRSGAIPGAGLSRWDDHLSELLLSRDTALVAAMARRLLAPLRGMRGPQRDRMADTLLAWLESGFNANEAAERLRIHPQTVRYRMRRLEELFGARLREPDTRFELGLVLRARRLLGPLE
ncbi:PucR family transcriptional regulator [Nocardiopsis alba]|uniref:PucR family transcriptional regulator n=1 Tax=Nocardiopsis alba TaxID=53437 RepID=UPI00366C8501